MAGVVWFPVLPFLVLYKTNAMSAPPRATNPPDTMLAMAAEEDEAGGEVVGDEVGVRTNEEDVWFEAGVPDVLTPVLVTLGEKLVGIVEIVGVVV